MLVQTRLIAGCLMLAAALLLPGAAGAEDAPAQSAHPVATDARLGGDGSQTRFILDLDRKIDIRAFLLGNPERVVLDIPQVTFRLPARTGQTGRGLVKAFRFGLVMQGGSRVVLDLGKPAKIEKAFVMEPANGQPARLILDLAPTDRETFRRLVASDSRGAESRAARDAYQAAAQASAAAGAPDSDPRPLIVLDPGHGGIDPGAQTAGGETEKAIVLDFALLLRDKLEKLGKYRVAMTRSDDTFVPLADRVAFARARQAALFVSLHADSLPRRGDEVQGASIYTLSDRASDAEAARLADSENRADLVAGVDLSSEPDDVAGILLDLAQRETRTFSAKFAHALVGSMRGTVRLHKSPLKSAGFRVLRAHDVPSVLVELGYVSNRSDLKALTSDAWRNKTAGALVQAIGNFFGPRLVAGATAPEN
ncbi:MAG TPA: N-acetylmuramoyl-L-alanine amidase [Xanthobacteraceae bacterium]|nr:N-acetylmuramoyl-L-alanine amidase [Xanthobacteraceae bacterium]